MEHVTREEFMDSQQRLHKRIDEITHASSNMDKSVEVMSNNVASMKEVVNKLHELAFGNGKPGLITRLANAFIHIKLQYALIFLTVSGLLSTAFFIIRATLTQ